MRNALIYYLLSEFFLSLGIGVSQYAQPFYYAAAHIGDQNIGYLFAVNGVFGGFGALVADPVADKIGATRIFKWGTALIACGVLATSMTSILPVWFVATAISGAGGAMLMSTENVVLNSLVTGYEKSHLISRFTAFYMVLIGLGALLAGWLVPTLGLQHTMLVAGIIVGISPCIRLLVKAQDARRVSLGQLSLRPLLLMASYAVLFGIAGGLFNPFATLILSRRHHTNATLTSLIYAIGLFMVAFGSYLVRPLVRKMRQGRTLVLSYVLSAAFTAMFLVSATTVAFIGLYFLLTITSAVAPPIVDAMFLDLVPPTEFSQMFGMRVFGTKVGNAIGSSIGGGLLNAHHFHWLMLLSAGCFLIAGVYLAFIRKTKLAARRSDQPAAPLKTPQ